MKNRPRNNAEGTAGSDARSGIAAGVSPPLRAGRRKRASIVGAALIAIALVAAGCSSSSGNQTSNAKDVKVSFLSLFRAGLAIQLNAGASQAAKEAGVTYNWFGPPGLDPPTQIKALQDAVSAGTTGIATMAFPGELWVRPIDTAVTNGATVVTVDVPSEGSKATTHFGPSKYAIGTALADAFAAKLGQNAQGYIQPGICVPGLPVLTTPFIGFTDRMKQIEPGITVREPVNTTGDPSTNFSAWQRLIQQEPDALGFIANCDQDVPNLIKIKNDTGGKYLIGATSGDSAENVTAVKDGKMDVIIGQKGFVDGYVTMHYLLSKLIDNKALPNGWVNTGYEVITHDNAATVLALQQGDPSAPDGALAHYKKDIDQLLANPAPKPIADQLTRAGSS